MVPSPLVFPGHLSYTLTEMLEPFGPNVVSTDGDLWRFHLRITATPLGEEMNSLVWSETIRQTKLLVASWTSGRSSGLKMDVYTLTLNVMSYAGFGQKAEWAIGDNAVAVGHKLSLVSSVFGVVTYLPHILLMPKWLLARSPWRKAHQSYVELDMYMREYLAREKKALLNGTEVGELAKGNFLTAVLRASMASGNEKTAMYNGRTSLTDDEITGNTFMFMLAGKSDIFHQQCVQRPIMYLQGTTPRQTLSSSHPSTWLSIPMCRIGSLRR